MLKAAAGEEKQTERIKQIEGEGETRREWYFLNTAGYVDFLKLVHRCFYYF